MRCNSSSRSRIVVAVVVVVVVVVEVKGKIIQTFIEVQDRFKYKIFKAIYIVQTNI